MDDLIMSLHRTVAKEGKRARRHADKRNRVLVVQDWTLDWMDHAEALIYARLVDAIHPERGYAYPSVATLADQIRRTPRRAQQLLDRLVKGGFIVKIEDSSPRGQIANRYYVLEHPFDPTYEVRWPKPVKEWRATDLVDYAFRGHGMPSDWSIEVCERVQQARRMVIAVAPLMDVAVYRAYLDGVHSDYDEDGRRRRREQGANVITPEESDAVVQELHGWCYELQPSLVFDLSD